MALFSQRFWLRLAALDARVAASQRAQHGACKRLLISHKLVTGTSLLEYWSELQVATQEARFAATELNHFCLGRSKMRSGAEEAPYTEGGTLVGGHAAQPVLAQ